MERRDGCPIKDDPIGNALRAIEGKWKVPVMYVLCKQKSMRYSELRKALDITNMMLTSTLKELEADGLVSRVQYNEVPPRVEYSATKNGKRLIPCTEGDSDVGRIAGGCDRQYAEEPQRIAGGGGRAGRRSGWQLAVPPERWDAGLRYDDTDPMIGERTELPVGN